MIVSNESKDNISNNVKNDIDTSEKFLILASESYKMIKKLHLY
jgi:hypothetical protein